MEDKLTAAESCMILKPSKVESLELLKHTMTELLFRKVLSIVEEWRLPHPRHTRQRLYTFVTVGDNYGDFAPNNYQKIFLNAFKYNPGEIIYLKKFFTLVLSQVEGIQHYKNDFIYQGLLKKGYLKGFFVYDCLGIYKLTTKGIILRGQLHRQIEFFTNSLKKATHENLGDLHKAIRGVGINILLIDPQSLENFKRISNVLKDEYEVHKERSNMTIDAVGSGLDLISYCDLNILNNFDFYTPVLNAGFEAAGSILESLGEATFGDIFSGVIDGIDFS